MKLIELARKTLEYYFADEKFDPDAKTKEKCSEKKASFVTLTEDGTLRGCIGSLVAHQPLWKDVQENTIKAAFSDPRFPPLSKEELNKIKIEVSVLSNPKHLEYKDEKDLLKKLNNKMGLILEKWGHTATFLPQVWEQISNKVEFLEQLSLKAGLNKDAWRDANYKYYTVKEYHE